MKISLSKIIQRGATALKNRHIKAVCVILIYLYTAPLVKGLFFLSEGKPVHIVDSSPIRIENAMFRVDNLEALQGNHDALYVLWGWSIFPNDPDQDQYERYVVLQSIINMYCFPVEDKARPDVSSAYPDIGFNILKSGYFSNISRDALPLGRYSISILYRERDTSNTFIIKTSHWILRTPNYLYLEKPAG